MKTQYTIVQTSTADKLIEKVQLKLDEGWQLQGGVSASIATVPCFTQALIFKSK